MIETSVNIISRNDKSQIVDYNNPLFWCFAQKNYLTADTLYVIPEHWHEDIEYFYVAEGKLEYIVNGEKILLKAGEGICVNSKRIHSNKSIRGEYCIFYCIIVHPSYLCVSHYIEQKYVNPIIGPDSFDYLLLQQGNWTNQILSELKRMFAVPDEEILEIEIIEVSFRILRIIYQNRKTELPQGNTSVQYVTPFKTMASFVQEHYKEKISLEEIAAAGNVGKTLCAKIFKKFASKTPGDYLIHYRITKAMELLKESDLSITEISYETGFNSASHFTKTFKEIVGCTPNKCRDATQEVNRFMQHY